MQNNSLKKITYTIILVNIILAVLKILAGIHGKSQALISDALHTSSDIFLSLIVIVALQFKSRKKIEQIASKAVMIVLIAIIAIVIYEAIEAISNYQEIEKPTLFPLIIAIIAIISKEILYRLSLKIGTKYNNQPVIINGLHQRLDALATSGALFSVAIAYLFSAHWEPVLLLDPIISIIISLFILSEIIKILLNRHHHHHH